jgi:hypothetical protein
MVMEGTRLSIEFDVPSTNHGKYAFVFNLEIDDEWAGRSCFKLIGERLLETHSSLMGCWQACGYGILMYSHGIRYALSEEYRVCSSLTLSAGLPVVGNYMSAQAERLWKGRRMNEMFDVQFGEGRFWVKGIR